MEAAIPIEFHWGAYGEADLRFVTARYRAGGPWMVRRVVHSVEARYGVSFLTKNGWRFLGLMVLCDQHVATDEDPDFQVEPEESA